MTTQAHRYDHPAYLIRQTLLFDTAAGANGTNAQFVFPFTVKLHRVAAVVRVAGTTATNTLTIRRGTTSLGLLTLADSAAGFSAVTGDLAATIAAGDVFNVLKGTDATGTAGLVAEVSIAVGQALTV